MRDGKGMQVAGLGQTILYVMNVKLNAVLQYTAICTPNKQ